MVFVKKLESIYGACVWGVTIQKRLQNDARIIRADDVQKGSIKLQLKTFGNAKSSFYLTY